jgi:hypothetical protein
MLLMLLLLLLLLFCCPHDVDNVKAAMAAEIASESL